MKTVVLQYKSTHFYLIDTGSGLFAFEAGWPDTYREYRDCLKAQGYNPGMIKWMMVSHFHIDHAGLAGDFIRRGVNFWVFRNQLGAIDEMEALMVRKGMRYTPVDKEKTIVLDCSASREKLYSIGISGEVIQTNGHGEQSVTLLLDGGEAFIGDLPPEHMVEGYDEKTAANWEILKSKGAQYIKPAHAGEYRL